MLWIVLFSYGCAGSSIAVCGLSLVVAGGAPLELQRLGCSRWWHLLFRSTGPRMHQFRGCGARAWLPQGMDPKFLDQESNPCARFGKRILSQWTTTEIHAVLFLRLDNNPLGFPGGAVGKNPPAERHGFDPWVRLACSGNLLQFSYWKKSHGPRSLVGSSPRGLLRVRRD